MFDIGPGELLLVAIIGLLVLGPQRLPKVAAEIGKWVGRARRTASQLRRQLEREMELSELETPPPTKPTTPPPAATPSPPPATQNPEVIASELQAANAESGEANSIGGAPPPREPSSSADQNESR